MKRDAESRTQVALSAEPAGAPRTRTSVDDRIVIRPFEPDDAAAVRALFITVNRLMAPLHLAVRFDAYIARALREEIDTIASYFAARGGQFFVATAAGELVGMFGFEMAGPDVAELRRMYIDPQFRRRGLGRELLAHAESEIRKAGCTRLILSTSELQAAALALYRTAGYREVRQDVATQATNKTLGGAVRRFHFEKTFDRDGAPAAARNCLKRH